MMPSKRILPGQMLGMLGGGQLGRFFVLAARQQGYPVTVLDPDPHSPAGQMANVHLCFDYEDPTGLQTLASTCQAITTEFENIPATTIEYLSNHTRTMPSAQAIAIAQDRIAEKTFLHQHNLPTAPCCPIHTLEDIESCSDDLFPGILKVSRFGYDGKGQMTVRNRLEAKDAFMSLGSMHCMLEKKIFLDREISVVFARDLNGNFITFPIAENHHRNGILDMSIVPARVSSDLKAQAIALAHEVACGLDYQGLGTVELFISEGSLYINEIAPRTHNSGHYTLNACDVSQFELQLRALCGFPLQVPTLFSEAVMVNILGDIWSENGNHPDWSLILNEPAAHLSLYGKTIARKGRKMGHYTVLGAGALNKANHIRTALGIERKPIT